MGVDYTAKAAFGIPVAVMSRQDAEDIDEKLPQSLTMIEFGSAAYGGDAHWVLGVEVGTSNFGRGNGVPGRLIDIGEQLRKRILGAVVRHRLETLGDIGYYIGGLVW